ncbi:MAG TPA: S-layer homology domain-containing protein, partial [Acidimicrobiia bacterium]|nr:S-layer homology domain-containing protein [Acidimicrobiia bacterium]
PIGTYLYHVDQAGSCGDGLWWGASLEQGRWHCIEGRVKMNTPGENDGLLRGWLDGELKLVRNDIQYRRTDQVGVGVRHMWHNVYFGGSWPTPNPLSLEYDQVIVSTSGRVGCLSAFTDIGETMHAKSIAELHALGYLYGCDYRKACPSRLLTRGEAAALISRILELPAATQDYFSDDQGSTFEGVINRLAEANIAKGCNPPTNSHYCPDRTMTRAEFATMLVRALGLGGSPPDAFSDDDGHWAEEPINLFAAAGLTSGCGERRFCPDRELPRDEAAAFFYRSLDLLKPLSTTALETQSDWPPQGEPPQVPEEEQD